MMSLLVLCLVWDYFPRDLRTEFKSSMCCTPSKSSSGYVILRIQVEQLRILGFRIGGWAISLFSW